MYLFCYNMQEVDKEDWREFVFFFLSTPCRNLRNLIIYVNIRI